MAATEMQHHAFNPTLTTTQAIMPERPRVPIVAHIITDDDIGVLKGTKLQPINLSRVVKLLTDPHSVHLIDRHINALQRLVKHYQKGFPMKDLVQVFKILNVCSDRVAGQDEEPLFEKIICDILKICSLPFLKEKSSDELVFEQIVTESVSQLGYLMRVPSRDIRKQICDTLVAFYSEKPTNQDVQKLQATSLSYNKGVIENSDVSETLVKSLALLEKDVDIKLAVLNVLQHFSKGSDKNCDQMLRAEAATTVCSRLMDPDPTGQLLFRSVDILWNMLENGDQGQLAEQLNNLTCISQLRDAFVYQLTQSYSHYGRQLRNDLLVIAMLVAAKCPNAPFVETGFAKQLTLFATFQEVKSHNALVKHLKLMKSHEDFELKKLLFSILVTLSRDPSVVPVLSEGHLMLALFSFVRANENTSGPREWTPAQFEEIQLHAMSCLCALVPLMIEDYMTCQGSTRLLLLLEWCVGEEDFGGHGNSFHGKGGRGNKRGQMRHCLRLLRSVVSTGDEGVLQDLSDQGVINQIITILKNAIRSETEDDAVDIEMQSDMLLILSCLCEGDMHRKELFGTEGVDVVIHYLRTNSSFLNSGLGHHRLLLSAVDCVWCAVVGCYITEDYFLEKEGVFLLIDLLEVCPKNTHNLILGCLLDLCENPKTIHHIHTWRGKDNCSAAHLFCDIYRNEEKDMGVKRDKDGAIADITKPLMGALQEFQGVVPLPASNPSQSIVDVSENMRAKLYSLFCKIGWSDLSGLTVEDHVTLVVLEKYLDFKMGEVWTEIIQELHAENVRPVTPDMEAIEAISRGIEERAKIVAGTQYELLEAQQNQDALDEQEFYAEIRENHRQKEKAMNDFTDFVARTSNFQLLKAAKKRQALSIEASLMGNKYREQENFHETELKNVHATAICNKTVAVESTPLSLTGGPLAKYDPKLGTTQSRKILKQKMTTMSSKK
ncbi:cilia- and flagella-associated protein 69-like [Crassostrea angulata]|uniref:Cilia- and flagella-associated protein 69 ARM repeats domain-containing protein n=1 Tax=Magallana gigas TaxID=29159 RepID=A0A8W8ME72_MAGGI|nr:cilia- and flagella-associated protein 69 [Crassostrea gigas]XP_019919796.2 cilia- and flagella-associated protein 69 [Crassostrea gigas]XP_052683421.1 cilia- and flagella-associated protein 69-like [Crassostrea angulata]